jgi:hypothetical protein
VSILLFLLNFEYDYVSICSTIIVGALGIIALVLGAFGIFMSFDKDFIKSIKEKKEGVYENIVFQFEYNTLLAIISIIIPFIYINFSKSIILYFLTLFLFSYSVIALMMLLNMIYNLAIQIAEFVSLKKIKEEKLKKSKLNLRNQQ